MCEVNVIMMLLKSKITHIPIAKIQRYIIYKTIEVPL